MSVQIIKDSGGPAYAVLPYNDYLQLLQEIEDARDIREASEISARIARGEEETIPSHVVRELALSERPLRIWREYRSLTQQELADQVGISKSYLSQIETGNRSGSANVLQRIAQALNVSLDDIMPISEVQLLEDAEQSNL
ncbi:MAG: helix-turn-helix transcriptional regulator [Chloroflexi bacterium]|nr:helix-turn-helix transcriptional regulator [Chloroflexota bacterium]